MSSISVFYGSVYGNAQNVAEEVQGSLTANGKKAELIEDPSVKHFTEAQAILVITSTTGQGDVPPNLEWVVDDLRSQSPSLEGKTFAVAALGDSSYGDSFCGAGKQLFSLLVELKATAIAPMLEVDAMETLDPEDDVKNWIDNLDI